MTILIAALALALGPTESPATVPEFEDFPVADAFRAAPAPPVLTSPRARRMRTQILRQAARGPDFAGHFTVVRWGCGAGCVEWGIVDARTGTVWFAPFQVWDARTISDPVLGQHSIDYRLDSELIVVNGARDGKGAGTYRYRWHGGTLTLLHALEHGEGGAAEPPLAGRWQYLQPPDAEGEVLDFTLSSGRWRGIMNGLERVGEHGVFYYVIEVERLEVAPDGTVRFEVGEHSLFRRRPPLSAVGDSGDAGIVRDRMRFTGRLEAGDLVLRCVGPSSSCPDSTVRFKRIPAPPGPGRPAAPGTEAFTVAVRFSVTDTTEVFERPLGRALRIRVTREPPLGWTVSVVRTSSNVDEPNLLYHSRAWHGPYPTDAFSLWHHREVFPDERYLPVYGYPYEIRIRLIDCRTSETGDNVVFEAGSMEVAWRRAKVVRPDY
jgi:hypothetical protein